MSSRSLTLFLTLSSLSCFAANAPEPPKLRLGNAVMPDRYAIDLTIVPDQDAFHGKADIAVRFNQPESLVWLNATKLDIKEARFESAGKSETATVVAGGDNFAGLQFARDLSG